MPQHEPTNRSVLLDDVENFGIEFKINQAGNPPSDLIHYHECYEVILYVQSNNTAYVEDQRFDIQTHDLLFIAPWQIHKIIYQPDSVYRRFVMYLNDECIRRSFSQGNIAAVLDCFNQKPCFKLALSLAEFSRLNDAMKSLTYHISNDSAVRPTLMQAYTAAILNEIYSILLNQTQLLSLQISRKKDIVAQCLYYINQHYQKDITLNDLQNILYLNKFYISRAFTQEMGTTIVQYLQFKRIIEAEKLLADTEVSIVEIGLSCGFNNLQHFYRTFKKMTGMTPKQYRDGKITNFTKILPNRSSP